MKERHYYTKFEGNSISILFGYHVKNSVEIIKKINNDSCLLWGVFDTTLCDEICQWPAASRLVSPGTPVSSTNKTDHHNITKYWWTWRWTPYPYPTYLSAILTNPVTPDLSISQLNWCCLTSGEQYFCYIGDKHTILQVK